MSPTGSSTRDRQVEPKAYPDVLLEAVALGTHEGPSLARLGESASSGNLHRAQSQELLALVEDLGDPDRDDEQMASKSGADQRPRSVDKSSRLCLRPTCAPSS